MCEKGNLAIVLVSGGMDSLVTAAIAHSRNHELAMLHVSYGQRTERREKQAFEEIAAFYEVPAERKLAVSIDYLRHIGGSSLTDVSIPVPNARGDSLHIPSTYVPFRNTHLLSIAVSWAEVIGAGRIFIGTVEPDSPGYPDCREEYFRTYEQLIKVGTRPETQVEIVTPILHMTKNEVLKEGMRLGAPFHLSWSCYLSEGLACGRCESCRARLDAFRQLNLKDPIPYQETG